MSLPGIGQVQEVRAEESSDFVIENGILTKYTGTGGNVVIPAGVTSIGREAFFDCRGLKSVTIPDSVTSIGGDAFNSCNGLASIRVESANSVYDSRDNCNAIIETETNTLIAGCKNTERLAVMQKPMPESMRFALSTSRISRNRGNLSPA